MDYRPNKLVPDSFHPVPSAALSPRVEAVDTVGDVEAIGFLVTSDGEVPAGLELSREALTAAGFSAEVGSSLVVAQPSAPLRRAVGGGPGSEQSTQTLRDAAAAFVRAVPKSGRLGFEVPGLGEVDPGAAAQALTEGAVLGRYRYDVLRAERRSASLDELHLVVTGADRDACAGGIAAGLVDACAATVARDLANTPAGHLTATNLA